MMIFRAAVISLALAGLIVSNAIAQGTGKVPVRSFGPIDDVLNFAMEGVSVSTPLEEVADVLQSKGYELVDDRPSVMVFTKGALQDFHSLPDSAGFVYRVTDSDQQRTIFLERPTTKEWKFAAASGEPLEQGPLPQTPDVAIGRALRTLVCEGIQDTKERKRNCRSDSTDTIETGFRPLQLSKAPIVLVYVNVRGSSGQIRITRYK